MQSRVSPGQLGRGGALAPQPRGRVAQLMAWWGGDALRWLVARGGVLSYGFVPARGEMRRWGMRWLVLTAGRGAIRSLPHASPETRCPLPGSPHSAPITAVWPSEAGVAVPCCGQSGRRGGGVSAQAGLQAAGSMYGDNQRCSAIEGWAYGAHAGRRACSRGTGRRRGGGRGKREGGHRPGDCGTPTGRGSSLSSLARGTGPPKPAAWTGGGEQVRSWGRRACTPASPHRWSSPSGATERRRGQRGEGRGGWTSGPRTGPSRMADACPLSGSVAPTVRKSTKLAQRTRPN